MSSTLGILLIGVLVFFVYFLPTYVAKERDHHQTLAIGVLNLLLGWTGLGWVIAMVWACTAVKHD
jgi:threonine/homoserine/homoserine lactone efflux protein